MHWVRDTTGAILAADLVCSALFCSALSPFKTLNLPFSSWVVMDCPRLKRWMDVFRVVENIYGFFFYPSSYMLKKKIPKTPDPESGWHSVAAALRP